MLNKVMQSKRKAESRVMPVSTAAEKIASIKAMQGKRTKNARKEQRRIELGDLAYSKPSDHTTGMNYGIDARKARKQNLMPANKVKKDSDFGTRTATFGSKTDAGINSYFRNKRGDNMPKGSK